MLSRFLPLGGLAKRALPLVPLLVAGCASEPTHPVAFVANSGGNQVQVIDLDSGRTVRTIHSGAGPWRLAVDPDRSTLWVQHWNPGTTSLIDLRSLRVRQTIPFRGPGVFSPSGDRFWTFSWPDYGFAAVGAADGRVLERFVTEVGKVSNLANAPGGGFYLLQRDLMSDSTGARYSYILGYQPEGGSQRAPRTLRTGLGPEDILVPLGEPFFVTADRGTDGISVVNSAGDRRTLRVCPAPRRLALSGDGRTLAVGCWQADAGAGGEVVLFASDFSARPWPTLKERARRPFTGVAALRFSPDGQSLYGLDEVFDRMVEWDTTELKQLREIGLGSKPRDFSIVPLPTSVGQETEGIPDSNSALSDALSKNRSWGAPFESLTWTELISWRERPESEKEDAAPGPPAWKVSQFLNGKGAIRSASPSGWRIADAGWSYSIREDGRFWRTPRQELLARVLALPNLPEEDAVRLMAGDSIDGAFASGGIAADVFCRHDTDDGPVLIWGASAPDEPVSQVWIEATTGAPLRLIEHLPVFAAGHAGGGSPETIDTRFLEWQTLPDGAKLPARFERVIDGRIQDVVFEDARSETEPDSFFDLARLGGVKPGGDYLPEPSTLLGEVAPPIMAADYLPSPWAPQPPYTSNPPTSGPRVRELAAWGVHAFPVPPALLVHNLEHGAVVLQYNCPERCDPLRKDLEGLATLGQPVIVAPNPYQGTKITVAAWGRLLTLDDWDKDRIETFIQNYAGADHHTGS